MDAGCEDYQPFLQHIESSKLVRHIWHYNEIFIAFNIKLPHKKTPAVQIVQVEPFGGGQVVKAVVYVSKYNCQVNNKAILVTNQEAGLT